MCDKCSKFSAIRKTNYEKCNIYPVSMFCYIKTSFVGSKLLLCKHDDCEHKKRLTFYTQYKISTAFCDFILKCRSWRIVDMVKDKKERKKSRNKNNKRKQKTTTKKYYCCHRLNCDYSLGGVMGSVLMCLVLISIFNKIFYITCF